MTRYLTPEEVAARVRLTPTTIRAACANGSLPATKLCNRWRITEQAFNEWLQAGEPEPGVAEPVGSKGTLMRLVESA